MASSAAACAMGAPFAMGSMNASVSSTRFVPAGRHAVHEAPCERLRGIEPAAEEDHLLRARLADDAPEPLRAAGARDDAERRLGQPELHVRRGDAQIADERELETAAERDAVERGDHGLRRPIERTELRAIELHLHADVVLRHALALLEIGARAEGLVAARR